MTDDQQFEVEQKFWLDDIDKITKLVLAKGGQFSTPVAQRDTYLAHPIRNFGETDEALRIRCVGEQNELTYKGPKIDATTKTRREIGLKFENGEPGFQKALNIWIQLGFRPVLTVEKQRQSASLIHEGRAFSIDLDSVAGLGEFIELETISVESELESARAALTSLAKQLELSRNERRSYLELLIES